jgi:aldose 1-epimerase
MNGVVLTYVSADGENGYPGKLSVAAKFSLSEDSALRIEYTARTDKPTVVNLSHHLYFNLAGSGTILGQSLQVFADRYTPVDARRVPTGQIDSVAGTALDLRAPTLMGDRIDSRDPQIQLAHGFDHNFVLDEPPHPGALRLAARIVDPASGRSVEVRTTEPGMQVYTGNGFNGSLMDAKGKPLVRGAGVALETQHFPNSPNQPEFPATVLRPGKVFESQTEYRLRVTN